jgi:hypothetical protein
MRRGATPPKGPWGASRGHAASPACEHMRSVGVGAGSRLPGGLHARSSCACPIAPHPLPPRVPRHAGRPPATRARRRGTAARRGRSRPAARPLHPPARRLRGRGRVRGAAGGSALAAAAARLRGRGCCLAPSAGCPQNSLLPTRAPPRIATSGGAAMPTGGGPGPCAAAGGVRKACCSNDQRHRRNRRHPGGSRHVGAALHGVVLQPLQVALPGDVELGDRRRGAAHVAEPVLGSGEGWGWGGAVGGRGVCWGRGRGAGPLGSRCWRPPRS